jgi:hypothetical protein
MQTSLKRLSIVAFVCFFPLAIIGMSKQRSSPQLAIKMYYASVYIFITFLGLLALYTYFEGGNFIKPMGTFY